MTDPYKEARIKANMEMAKQAEHLITLEQPGIEFDMTIDTFVEQLKIKNKRFFEDSRNMIAADAWKHVPEKLKRNVIDPAGMAIFCWQSNGYKFTWINSFGELKTLHIDNHGEFEVANVLNTYTSAWGVSMILEINELQFKQEDSNNG